VLVTLREAGELAGYCTVFVGRSMHYDVLQAAPDLLYVRASTRRRVTAVYRRLMRATERELRRRGVRCWFQGAKVHRSARRLLLAMGFEPTDEYMCKWF
jgi:GNAT superfamily N-acetyltransferase